MTREEFETLEWELQISGYGQYIDPIDYEVAVNHTCEECGGHQEGIGYKHFSKRIYRAFAQCKTCGNTLEF